MAKQCPKPKRKRDATWFRDKVLLVEAQGSGKVLNEEELAFLADLGVTKELSDEQALWLQTSHPNTDQSASSHVKIEAPRELPKFLGTVKFGEDQIAKIMRISRNQPLYIVNWGYDGVFSNLSLVQSLKDQILVKFLATKDEAPDFIIKFLKMIQVRLNATVRNIQTDNGTEFVNQNLHSYYESVGISHETSVARCPQQNGFVKRRNRTLVKAARTMLIDVKDPLFLWAKAVATACYTQNRSIIRRRHGKTPYELLNDRKPDLSYPYVFGALCYPNNDSEDLGKLQAKADIGIFIRYAPKKKAYHIYNRRTRKIIETIHVDFDELTTMVSEQLSSGPGLQFITPATSSSGLVSNPIPHQPCNPLQRDDWDLFFQPMFDEYFNPSTIVVCPVPVAATPRTVDLADSHVSTSIDQDAPSTSILSHKDQDNSPIMSQGF
ncbi:retrovirus-related pol polyprotein from transposon TNT 1-94 [Tanacetum coccineum]